MSIKVMAAVWESDLPSDEKFVALALADWADDTGGSIFPSQARIGWKVGKTDRAARYTITKLLERGVLAVIGGGNGSVIHYRMILSALPARMPFATPEESSGVDENHPGSPLPPTPEVGFRPPRKPASDDPSSYPSSDPLPHKRRVTGIDDEFRAEMVARYQRAGTAERINSEIDDALGHEAALKRTDLKAYVRNWLSKTNFGGNTNGHRAAGGGGVQGAGANSGATGRGGVHSGAKARSGVSGAANGGAYDAGFWKPAAS